MENKNFLIFFNFLCYRRKTTSATVESYIHALDEVPMGEDGIKQINVMEFLLSRESR